MKIKKNNLNEGLAIELLEAEDEPVVTQPQEDADVVVNAPASASTADIAAAVTAGVEAESEGEKTVSPGEANKVAAEVKKTASEIDTKAFVALGVENELTEVLDEALDLALALRHQKRDSNCNILITGLPGSSKSAIVKEWADRNNINLFFLNAKDNDLEANLSGFAVQDNDNGTHRVIKAYSNVLDPLDSPRSVLVLDELNRQTNPAIRASLLTLINEKDVAGPGKDGRRHFDNLLFTIATINPAVPTDQGAAPLNDAEMSRYPYNIQFDSNILTALEYFRKHYAVYIALIDTTDSNAKDIYNEYIRELALALAILGNQKFEFNTVDDLDDLATQSRVMLNQRTLTNGINISRGSCEKFLNWVDRRSKMLDRDVAMFHEILDDYNEAAAITIAENAVRRVIEERYKKGIAPAEVRDKVAAMTGGSFDWSAGEADSAAENDAEGFDIEDDGAHDDVVQNFDGTISSADDFDDVEDDTDLFQRSANTGRRVLNPAERIAKLSQIAW